MSSALPSDSQSEKIRFGDDLHLGPTMIGASLVLYSSPSGLSTALTGIQPVLPGHSVIVPRRSVSRLSQLSDDELLDLWRTALQTQDILCRHYGGTASNWAISDGFDAGQSWPHTHLHVVPRRPGDLEVNDEVYAGLDAWKPSRDLGAFASPPPIDWPTDEDREPRTSELMAAEAASYRALKDLSNGVEWPQEQAFSSKIRIPGSNVFFVSKSGLTVAFVNLKPLVPGHVLVIPVRVASRLADLTKEEFDDLFLSVRIVQMMVQEFYGAKASKLGVQDGKDAGQTVPHVHVHVLPIVAKPSEIPSVL